MMGGEEPKQIPEDPYMFENGAITDSLFSPRFKSVAAMAGWDEEALLVATLVVEDTPDRESRHKKRSDLQFKSPGTNSRRKRRSQRRSPVSFPVTALNLDEEDCAKDENAEKKTESKKDATEERKKGGDELPAPSSGGSSSSSTLPAPSSGGSSSSSTLPCMDKLREELSCAICLEICFEPSTTPCGHSFCKKCLRSAADKCGKKCPKCRQLISNGRACTVNTVLWNTIQLLFPQEIEARKAAGALNCREEAKKKSPERESFNNARNRIIRPSGGSSSRDVTVRGRNSYNFVSNRSIRLSSGVPSRDASSNVRRRSAVSSQDEDAALALRLQREEFMEAFSPEQTRSPISLVRENLRAMQSRARDIRLRSRP